MHVVGVLASADALTQRAPIHSVPLGDAVGVGKATSVVELTADEQIVIADRQRAYGAVDATADVRPDITDQFGEILNVSVRSCRRKIAADIDRVADIGYGANCSFRW